MRRACTIIGVRDVTSSFRWYQSLFGQPEAAPDHDALVKSLDTNGRWKRLAPSPPVGLRRASVLDESGDGVTWQRSPVVLSSRRFQHGTEESTRARHPVRRGAPREPE